MSGLVARVALLGSLLALTAPDARAGAIRGTVTTDAPARAGTLAVTQDNPVCGDAVPDESLLVEDGKLANAVVFLEGLQAAAPPDPVEATLDQRGCTYVPHVQAVPVNSTLVVINSDDVLHNVHSYLGGERTVFNLAMPEQDQRIPRPLRRPGLVDMKCDAGHTWMRAYVYVFDHPWFAVTGADGTYAIDGVPPGAYTLTVWHETLGTVQTPVTVAEEGDATVDVALQAP